ncbi:MAG TPA: hypothetical protein DDY57_13190 [Franconibacter pulveris]|nr:hypothetical protein [Franconibacter pulveris]
MPDRCGASPERGRGAATLKNALCFAAHPLNRCPPLFCYGYPCLYSSKFYSLIYFTNSLKEIIAASFNAFN